MSATQMMIVAGEASGDLHAASLVAAMKARQPGLSFSGVGGPAMAGQGVELIFDAGRIAVVGLTEVVGHLGDIRQAMRLLEEELTRRRPALLILIDFPDFNLILAKKAKRLGVPVFYYITPQVWAWRSGRVRTIGRLADRVAVILPFEQEFFRQRGVAVDFVGHPLLDVVPANLSRSTFRSQHGLAEKTPVVGLLPGSRRLEIAVLLPVFLKAAKLFAKRHSEAVFLLPLAPTFTTDDLAPFDLAGQGLDIRVVADQRYEAMAACDAALAASGTVTLELAILNVPMLMAYRVTPLTWHIGRRLVRLKHLSLVNLVAGREVVPEILQYQVRPARIYEELEKMMTDANKRADMLNGLALVRERLGGPGAAARAATIALAAAGVP
ncbi:MAG: lipid-A-disaccharide synthase [Desulfobacterales bacterium CG2_30_60_27]|nr:MAG: lipid-A-disaccharide synthase [Desulfobacterales bacterium CG2_30_60_27]